LNYQIACMLSYEDSIIVANTLLSFSNGIGDKRTSWFQVCKWNENLSASFSFQERICMTTPRWDENEITIKNSMWDQLTQAKKKGN